MEHHFWNKQPVEVGEGNNPIKNPSKISVEPYVLPEGFTFDNVSDVKELSRFLLENYVEDKNEEFRLQYSENFLSHLLSSPKHNPEYSLGLKFNGSLVGYVFAKEYRIILNNVEKRLAAVNFLCISKSLRGKRIAPVLIKEITRRCNCNGLYQAIFTSGTEFFFQVCKSTYYHKSLNVKKLNSTGFSSSTEDSAIKKARNSSRLLQEQDIPKVFEIYKDYIKKYKIVDSMDLEDFKYNMLPHENVTSTYVYVENDDIVAFGSYYILDTLSIKKNQKIKGAYLNYTCGKDIKAMVEDLVYYASADKCDVFNCIDVGNAGEFLEELKFEIGTGTLNYYLYNWKTNLVDKKDIFFYLQ